MHSKATLLHPHLCAFLSIAVLGLGCDDAQQTRYTHTVIGTNNSTSDVFNTATASEDDAIAEGSMACAEASDCSGPGPEQCATPFGGWECVEGRCEVTCAAIPDNICDVLLAELPEQLDAASSCTQNSDCTVWNNPLYCATMSPPLSDCDFYTTANTPERAALDDLLGDLVANACAEAQGNCGGCLEPPSAVCLDGMCVPSPCEAAIDRLFGPICNLTFEGLGNDNPEALAHITQMLGEDTCTGQTLCTAACMADAEENLCFECHLDGQECVRDPLAECLAERCPLAPEPMPLCLNTGGLWDDGGCPNCCGPTPCGEDPTDICPLRCCGPPQCICPDPRPFWSPTLGCFTAEACFP